MGKNRSQLFYVVLQMHIRISENTLMFSFGKWSNDQEFALTQ